MDLLFVLILTYFQFLTFGHGDSCEPNDSWAWTPWFNFHHPTGKGEYELHAAIRSQHPTLVCAEPRSVSAVNQAGVDMNQTLDMIVLRSYDVFCLNSYDPRFQKKICDDYSVRYCCPKQLTQPQQQQPQSQSQPQPQQTQKTEDIRQMFIEANENSARAVQSKCGRAPRATNGKSSNFFVNLFDSMLSKIINGVESRPNSWPWVVSIGVQYRNAAGAWQNRTHICGGTLIDPNHVLTAGHCLEQKIDDRFVPLTPTNPTLESFFFLRIGIHDIRSTKPPEIYRARRVFSHEKFISSTFENDIAMIRLDRPVSLTENTMPICLPSNNVPLYKSVTVAGWGTVAETSRVHSNVLRQANVTVLPPVNCRVYKEVHFDTTRQLCAAALDWSKDTCAGDSGGPLMYQENGSWTIGGITSYGYGCSKRGFPGVYVRTAAYSPWIKQKMLAG